MRIVDRKTFLSLPSGTVYAKWGDAGRTPADQDMTYGEVAVKGRTVCSADFVSEPFMAWPENVNDSGEWLDAMSAAINGQETAPLAIGESGSKDGSFDEQQLFAVFNRVEVERLIALLQSSLPSAHLTSSQI